MQTLKDAGITPISIGEGDKWPGMHFWNYLATRICGQANFEAALARTGSFTDPCFVEAGAKLQELIALEPFQDGFLGATHDEMQATFGNGQAAMELSGQWAPSTQAANAADQVGVGENLGLFGFPEVEDGAGAGTDVVGGGNGFAIGKNAEPEAIDFVKYLTSVENQSIIAANGSGIPVVKGAETGTDGSQHAPGRGDVCSRGLLPALLRSVPAPGHRLRPERRRAGLFCRHADT